MTAIVLGGLVHGDLEAATGSTRFQDKLTDYAFVASKRSPDITILSTKHDAVIGTLALDAVPTQIVVSENQRMLIATHAERGEVILVDLDRGESVAIIALGFRPDRLKIDDGSGVIAVSGREAGKVTVISLVRRATLFTVDHVAEPADVMFNRKGKWLYIAEGDTGTVTILEAATGMLVKRLALEAADDDVVELVRTPGGKTGLALHGESGLISALDLDQGEQVGGAKLPGPATRGFPSANSQYFLIPNDGKGTMSLVSSWTYRESMSLPAPKIVAGINHAMFDTLALAFGQAERQARARRDRFDRGCRQENLRDPERYPSGGSDRRQGDQAYRSDR